MRPPLTSTGTRNGMIDTRCGAFSIMPLALGERLVDEAELALVEVAQTAVHELGAAAAGARREVVALDERGPQATRGGVERDAGAGDPAAHHEHVEVVVTEPMQRAGAVERGARHREQATGGLPGPVRRARRSFGRSVGRGQATTPGEPASVTTSKPPACHAFMPPTVFTASKPVGDQQLGHRPRPGARAADGHDAAVTRELAGTGLHLAHRHVHRTGRVPGLPLVGLPHVEEEGAAGDRRLGVVHLELRHFDAHVRSWLLDPRPVAPHRIRGPLAAGGALAGAGAGTGLKVGPGTAVPP